jgi:hypothetical protein
VKRSILGRTRCQTHNSSKELRTRIQAAVAPCNGYFVPLRYDAPIGTSLDVAPSTDDGGLLATQTNSDSEVIHFDPQGNPGTWATIPFLESPLAFSWPEQWYVSYTGGQLATISLSAMVNSISLWAQVFGNSAGQHREDSPFPQLVSCFPADNPNPPQCPRPRQVIFNAYKALAIQNPVNSAAAILQSNKSLIQTWVFDKINSATGKANQVSNFIDYLQKGFLPYDGTKSTARLTLLGGPQGRRVKDIFFTPSGENDPNADAATFLNKAP